MKALKLNSRVALLLAALVAAFSLTACAGSPLFENCPDNRTYNQTFSFDAKLESPNIEIMDYFYGIPNCPAIHNPEQYANRGASMQGEDQTGPFSRAQKLYVKWRNKNAGKEYEVTVDLHRLLPRDMSNHGVHFAIKEDQLYVYLITPERRPLDMPPNGPRETQYLKTITIYPENQN